MWRVVPRREASDHYSRPDGDRCALVHTFCLPRRTRRPRGRARRSSAGPSRRVPRPCPGPREGLMEGNPCQRAARRGVACELTNVRWRREPGVARSLVRVARDWHHSARRSRRGTCLRPGARRQSCARRSAPARRRRAARADRSCSTIWVDGRGATVLRELRAAARCWSSCDRAAMVRLKPSRSSGDAVTVEGRDTAVANRQQ